MGPKWAVFPHNNKYFSVDKNLTESRCHSDSILPLLLWQPLSLSLFSTLCYFSGTVTNTKPYSFSGEAVASNVGWVVLFSSLQLSLSFSFVSSSQSFFLFIWFFYITLRFKITLLLFWFFLGFFMIQPQWKRIWK